MGERARTARPPATQHEPAATTILAGALRGGEAGASIIPFAGMAVLFASMRRGVHVTEEVSVNVMLASPLLLALGFLLVWAPPRFGFFYSEYRLVLLL